MSPQICLWISAVGGWRGSFMAKPPLRVGRIEGGRNLHYCIVVYIGSFDKAKTPVPICGGSRKGNSPRSPECRKLQTILDGLGGEGLHLHRSNLAAFRLRPTVGCSTVRK